MDELTFDDVEEAQTDRELCVKVKLRTRNGDGNFHEKEHEIFYRPVTNEMLQTGNTAEALSKVITRWPFKEPPTFEVLRKRPQPFLMRISEAIMGDFFPK